MDYNDYHLNTKEKIIFICGLTVFIGACGYVFYESFFPILLEPLFYRKAEAAYRKHMAENRKNQLLLEFRDFLFSLSSSFATGRHMTEGMVEAAENLKEIYKDKSILAEELSLMVKKINETGETDAALLDDFAWRSHLEDIQDFTAVYRACRKTGGSLVLAINKAASIIGDKIAIEREIQVMASQKKLEGRIITGLPFIITLFLQMVSPEYLEIMYTTFSGRLLMTLALFSAVSAFVIIERITKIEV